MKVKFTDSNDFELNNIVVDVNNKLMVCAHCNQCLNQLIWSPNKLNVVVYYRNEKGEEIEWKPEAYKQSLIQWLEGEKNISSNHPELGIFAEECECSDCTYDIGFKRAIDKVIQHIKEL